MTNTVILDAMMAALKRNPLDADRLGHNGLTKQAVQTDDLPFYSRAEVIETKDMNKRYADRIDLFHQSIKEPRWERPRIGDCNNIRRYERHMDGEVWTRTEKCPGPVHAVETRIDGAVRVDGKCLSCGGEIHRAGLLKEN